MVLLLTQATNAPPPPPRRSRLSIQISVLLPLREQNLRLLRQARNVHEALRRVTRASAHEALLRASMDGLRADVARLPFRVLRALLDRVRHGLRIFVIRMKLLGTAASFNILAEVVMAAFFPVLLLAGRSAVARFAAAALLGGQGWQRGSTCGAVCEDHSSLL